MIDPDIERKLISVGEAAAILSVSRSFAYEMVTAGVLISVRLGRRVLVPVSALDDLIANHVTNGPH